MSAASKGLIDQSYGGAQIFSAESESGSALHAPSRFDMIIVEGSNFTNTAQTHIYIESGQAADRNPDVNTAAQEIVANNAQEHSITLKEMDHFNRGAEITIDLTQSQKDLNRRFDILRINE